MLFETAVQHVLKWEGGYVNDPNDPGGETKFGISKRMYPDLNIAGLTVEQATEIYYQDYWLALFPDKIPPALRLGLFDCAVNQGVTTAKKLLQRALGVKDDGLVGPKTLEALKNSDVSKLCVKFFAERAVRYAKTKNFDIYGKGWMTRLMDVARA